MKKILIAIFLLGPFLLSLPTEAAGQNRPLNKFYRKYKKGRDVQNIKLPGWLIRTGGKIAIRSEDMAEDEAELAKQLIKKVGSMKLMYSEDGADVPSEAIDKLKHDLKKTDFEDLIMIKTGEINFDFMIEESGGLIKNIFMIYNNHEDGEMAFITLKTKLNIEELQELVNKEMEENYHQIIEGEEVEPIVVPLL